MINRMLIAGALLAVAVAKAYAYIPVMLHPDGASFGTRAISASQGQQVGVMQNETGAFLWHGTAKSMISLNPPGYSSALVSAVFGGRQIGGAINLSVNRVHALMWNSSPTDFVNLHTTAVGNETFTDTYAYGIGGNQQVGLGLNPDGGLRALLWTGTAQSAVLLHPGGLWWHTEAYATDGLQQVGRGVHKNIPTTRPVLWSGSAASMIDLMPEGATEAIAWDVANGQQVGYADFGPQIRNNAILWFGSASSFVNLNPGPEYRSIAFGTNGTQQVGAYGISGQQGRAAAWSGSAASMHDLHQYLPAGWNAAHSAALGIDELGNVVGYITGTDGMHRAVMWVVPEPGTMAALAAGIGLLALRRRRRCASD